MRLDALFQKAKRESSIEGTRGSSLSPSGDGRDGGVAENSSQNGKPCGSMLQRFHTVVGMSLNSHSLHIIYEKQTS